MQQVEDERLGTAGALPQSGHLRHSLIHLLQRYNAASRQKGNRQRLQTENLDFIVLWIRIYFSDKDPTFPKLITGNPPPGQFPIRIRHNHLFLKVASNFNISLFSKIKDTFLGCGVTLNILELLTFLLVWPFNRIAYRRIVYYLSYSFWACNYIYLIFLLNS